MNEFEMIEKLVAMEKVSFEEARDALRACNGDMIEAVVFLERKAKANAKANAVEDADQTADTRESVKAEEEKKTKEDTRNTGSSFGSKLRGFCVKAKDFLMNNSLRIIRNEDEFVRIPAWLAAIVVVFAFHITAIVLIVSLFLGCRYSFVGKDDMSKANEMMGKASDMAEELKSSLS